MADPQVPKDTTPAPAVPGATPEPPKRKTISDFFEPVVPLLTFLTMLGAAFWAGQAWDEKRANTMESCLRERQGFLESQIKDSKAKNEQDSKAVEILTVKLKNCEDLSKAEVAAANPHPPPSPLSEVETQVISGETAKVFSRQLFITLGAIQPSPAAAPLRYQAVTTLGAPGKSSEDFRGYAGQSKQFAGFEIRIIGVDAATATFHIRKLDSTSLAP